MRKIFCLLLVLIMMFNTACLSHANNSSHAMTKEEWDSFYSECVKNNNLPTLNVGADETQVSLCWHSDSDKAVAEVRVAENAEMNSFITFKGDVTPSDNDTQSVCRVTVTDLKEHSDYYYQWHTGDGFSKVYKYSTKSFCDHKAIVVGDIQITEIRDDGNNTDQSRVGLYWYNFLDGAIKQNPDISYLISPGDNTSTGSTDEEWQTLLMPETLRSLPVALAIGNHDKKGMKYNYFTNMPNEDYGRFFSGLDRNFWFRYGDVLYLSFDSTSGNAPDHMRFAKKAIEQNQDAKWRIGLIHHGIYGSGDAIGDTETEILLTNIFAPIFQIYDFDLVVTGHTHSQGRSHFMHSGKIKTEAPSGGRFVNPEGIVYLNSNVVCDVYDDDFDAEHLAYKLVEDEVTTYSTLEFKGDELILETRRGDNHELLDSIIIKKTVEHNDNTVGKFFRKTTYKIIEFVGFIYTMVDNLVRKISK
ncbi:MAG: metallophosphoesterase family protein [Clostridia bacterium]|nr:metallophosphoesterase family protein [Clostridia bacterium]